MEHIAIVSTSYPDTRLAAGREAAGSFVEDFAIELAKHRPVSVVAPSYQASVEQKDNLQIHRFAVPRLPLSLLTPTNPLNLLPILRTLQAGQQTLEWVAREESIDYIFALWALPSGYWARKVGQQLDIPYSIWALGSDIWKLGRLPGIRSVLRRVLRDSHTCFADGYQLGENVTSIAARPCHFLPSVRRLPEIGEKALSPAPPYRLAYLGRWHRNKGIDLLLESLHQLDESVWQKIEAIQICGGGPLNDLVQKEHAALQAAGHPVTLRGYLDRPGATELLMWADYLLIPSRIESIPVVFSDAMQYMCPVIAMPVGDLPRLLDRYCAGKVAKQTSATDFARAIGDALERPPLAHVEGMVQAKSQFAVTSTVAQFLDMSGIGE